MSQVFNNLIINAAQAMPAGGSVTISGRNVSLSGNNPLSLPPGTYVSISCADEGNGIPDTDINRIFDPYFTTKRDGNGLGLASVHSIITRHAGHIGVSSTSAQGTTFTIHLPSLAETYQEYQSETVMPIDDHQQGGAILVMDDEEMIRDMAYEMLTVMGYQVTTCENGQEAITQYQTALDAGVPFSAVIMDLTVPGGMGGKEAAQQILGIDATANLIVSSGYSHDPIMSDYQSYGFNGAVAKPYRFEELSRMLMLLIARRQQIMP
jgi:CheY-like chemotaxis protein